MEKDHDGLLIALKFDVNDGVVWYSRCEEHFFGVDVDLMCDGGRNEFHRLGHRFFFSSAEWIRRI